MHDRVVDRSAAHATPTELAVRDWLLVALSFATGTYEAIYFLTFGKVLFTGGRDDYRNQCPRAAQLGRARSRPPSGGRGVAAGQRREPRAADAADRAAHGGRAGVAREPGCQRTPGGAQVGGGRDPPRVPASGRHSGAGAGGPQTASVAAAAARTARATRGGGRPRPRRRRDPRQADRGPRRGSW
jgi:hypothetical protein